MLKNNIPTQNQKYIDIIKKEFEVSLIKPNIVSLIVHGSSLFQSLTERPYSDIDIELILIKQTEEDYTIIKEIVGRLPIRMEVQLRYINEITNKHGVILSSYYKIFMYYAYANGYCLIGENVYKKLISELKEKEVKHSILISLQIAFKDIRKKFFSCNNLSTVYETNKCILRFFQLICMYEGALDYKDLGSKKYFDLEKEGYIPLLLELYSEKLSDVDIKTLKIFPKSYIENELNQNIFPCVNNVMKIIEDRNNSY